VNFFKNQTKTKGTFFLKPNKTLGQIKKNDYTFFKTKGTFFKTKPKLRPLTKKLFLSKPKLRALFQN